MNEIKEDQYELKKMWRFLWYYVVYEIKNKSWPDSKETYNSEIYKSRLFLRKSKAEQYAKTHIVIINEKIRQGNAIRALREALNPWNYPDNQIW